MSALPPQVLQTGDEIAELDQSGFSTQETTVWAGNIGQKKYNVQVWCWDVGRLVLHPTLNALRVCLTSLR